jgi:OOP family OmpA-OmpF porin
MRARKVFAAAVLGLGALMAVSQASAQGFYIGGSVGESDADEGNAIPDLITSGPVDGKDSGMKFFGGYQFNQNLAVELAYVDLGKATYSGTFGGSPVTGGSVKTSGLNASVVGTLPLNPSFSLFAKAGMFAWEAKARDITGGAPFSDKDDGADLSFGFGGAYNLTKNFSLRAEWEQFEAVDKISLLSVGVAYKF